MTISIPKIKKIQKKLRKLFPITPLQYSKYLSEKYGAKIYLKREDLTPVRSYKIRGAFNFISQLTQQEQDRGLVCASAGNHAQGFAFSCSYFKKKGVIFMPITTPHQKIAKTQSTGGDFTEITLVGDTFDEAAVAAQKFCDKKKAVFVPPFDHQKIIEGQATIATEILDQIDQLEETIDSLFIPVGGGGLSAGLSDVFSQMSPDTQIHCIEPLGAPSLSESLRQGKLVELDRIDSFVDGAAVKKIGKVNFEILRKNIENPIVLIPENRLCKTMLSFLFHEGIILEPAGGLSVDALRDFKKEIRGKTIVCVISGGNFDFERLPDVKERAMKYSGTKKYFILRLPQRPGALREFLGLMSPADDISRFEYLKKSTKNFGSVLLGIETSSPENFPVLFEKMLDRGFEFQDVTDDAIFADFII